MVRSLVFALLLASLSIASGCALCCAPYDCDYLYRGGAWVRTDPSSGRVGSRFDEVGSLAAAAPAAASQPTPAPPPAAPPTSRSSIPRNMGEGYLP